MRMKVYNEIRGIVLNDLTNFYKILSDETRIRILLLLKFKQLCVCELCGIMEESQPKISKHLAKLRDIGLIVDKRYQQFIFYSLRTDNSFYLSTINNLLEIIDEYPILKRDLERSKDAEKYIETK